MTNSIDAPKDPQHGDPQDGKYFLDMTKEKIRLYYLTLATSGTVFVTLATGDSEKILRKFLSSNIDPVGELIVLYIPLIVMGISLAAICSAIGELGDFEMKNIAKFFLMISFGLLTLCILLFLVQDKIFQLPEPIFVALFVLILALPAAACFPWNAVSRAWKKSEAV